MVDLDTAALSRFDNASFDTVLMLDIVEHLDNDQGLIEDAWRVCRKNVILTVPARMPEAMSGGQLVFGAYVDPTHRRYYTFGDLQIILQRAGFTEMKVEKALGFDPILYKLFPKYLRLPLQFINRALLKFCDPRLFASVWFALGSKGSM